MKNVLFASTNLLPARWWETTVRGRWNGPRENALNGKVLEEIALDSFSVWPPVQYTPVKIWNKNSNTLLAVTWFWWSTKFRWKKESNKQLRQRHFLCWMLTVGVQSTESMPIDCLLPKHKGWTAFLLTFFCQMLVSILFVNKSIW